MITLRESIEIESPPRELFDWFRNLDNNYAAWHSAHIKWAYVGGFKEGARCHYEERLHGDVHKVDAVLVKIVEDELIEFRNGFPISIVCPGGAFAIQKSGKGSLVTATLLFRAGWLFSIIAPHRVDAIRNHMREESRNLKMIMERRSNEVTPPVR